MEEGEKKTLGLFYYKLICEHVKNHSVQFMRERQSGNSFVFSETLPNLQLLLDQQNALVSRAARSSLLIECLAGNEKAFGREMIDEIALISELVDFEGSLKTIRILDAFFSFETDPFIIHSHGNAFVNVVADPDMAPIEKSRLLLKVK